MAETDEAFPRPRPPRRRRWITRGALLRLALLALAVVLAGTYMMWMPGQSFTGALSPLSEGQQVLRDEMRRDIEHLAGAIGERHVWRPRHLQRTTDFLREALASAGLTVHLEPLEAEGVTCHNVHGRIDGHAVPEEIILLGAHYDTVQGSPGADDNASGVAGLLALARRMPARAPARTIRFALFVNEEPPFFQGPHMGSLVHARACRARGERIVAMLALDGIGYYTDAPGSQTYPVPIGWLYPNVGDFITFVGNVRSSSLVRRAIGTFRRHAAFPSEGAALPGFLPGVCWSDHWAFWQAGYEAILITDTLPYRNPGYHSAADLGDRIDYERMARVVSGLEAVLDDLAGTGR